LQKGLTDIEINTFFSLLIEEEEFFKRSGEIDAEMAAKGIKNLAVKRVKVSIDKDAGSTDTEDARDLYSSLRTSLTSFFVSLFDAKKTPTLDVVKVIVERMIYAMDEDRFAMISRLHTKHDRNDLVAHSINTAIIAYVIAENIGIEAQALQDLLVSGLLHDIGLMDIPPKIENGMILSSEDSRIFLEHPMRAVGILRAIPSAPQMSEVVAFEHHLQLDGKGFPKLKSKHDIHPASRIVALASKYDRLLQAEEYLPPEEIPARMIRMAGAEFDPEILAYFITALGVYPPGTYVKLSSGETGLVVEPNHGDVFRPIVKLMSDQEGREYLEDKFNDLTDREAVTGQYVASIVKSVPPSDLDL